MNLDLINNIFNNLKENKFVQNFKNELSNYLENNIKNEKIPIIENILANNNLTTVNKRNIMWNENNVILKYSEKIGNNEPIYFVKDSKKTYWLNNKKHYNYDVYTVIKAQNKKIQEMEISKQDMPKHIGVNDVFKIKNGNYIIDNIATTELQKEITDMAKKIIDKQKINLDGHRKEGHLYMVTEELGNNRFLWDLTDAPKTEFEEVDIPKDLLDRATEGVVLKYINGKYEYYSDDGFERAEKKHFKELIEKSNK